MDASSFTIQALTAGQAPVMKEHPIAGRAKENSSMFLGVSKFESSSESESEGDSSIGSEDDVPMQAEDTIDDSRPVLDSLPNQEDRVPELSPRKPATLRGKKKPKSAFSFVETDSKKRGKSDRRVSSVNQLKLVSEIFARKPYPDTTELLELLPAINRVGPSRSLRQLRKMFDNLRNKRFRKVRPGEEWGASVGAKRHPGRPSKREVVKEPTLEVAAAAVVDKTAADPMPVLVPSNDVPNAMVLTNWKPSPQAAKAKTQNAVPTLSSGTLVR